jgi:hypothetical protein
VKRVPLRRPLTPQQKVVVALIARLWNYSAIAEELQVNRETVKTHAQEAAEKIVGDWPVQMKCALWYAGAPREVLTRQLVKLPHLLEGDDWPVGESRPAPLVEDCAITVT